MTGYTSSCTFPTTAGAFSTVPGGYVSQNFCNGGFLPKLNAAGSGLVWSTYTGNNGVNGYNNDNNDAVALGPDGSVYVVGDEQGVALSPTVNPIFTQSESHFTYVKHFTADGASLLFSSAIGGTTDATSIPAGILVDPANNIYIAGSTNSATWPTTAGAFQKNSANPGANLNDTYVVKIAPTSTTTTALTLPTGTVTAGQSVKLTAKVTGQTGSTGTPTGTITFLSGTTTLGTATLSSGAASYSTSTLAAGAHSITATYGGDSLFSTAVSTPSTITINAPASITFAVAPTSLTIVHGASGSVVITGTPVGSYTGSVSFACGALPTAATCVFSPTSLSFTGNNTPQSATLTLSTVTVGALELPTFGRSAPGIFTAVLLLPLGLLMRGRRRGVLKVLLVQVLATASASGLDMTGCSSSSKTATSITTRAGSYTIAVTVSTTTGTSTLNVPIAVQ